MLIYSVPFYESYTFLGKSAFLSAKVLVSDIERQADSHNKTNCFVL